MKKKKHILLISIILLIIVLGTLFAVTNTLQNNDAYNVIEKKYIIDNKSKLITINVLNDANVFGKDGEGVFYQFIDDFEESNELSFDIVTIQSGSTVNGLSLTKSSTLPSNAKLFYTDHFVLVGKNRVNISKLNDITATIGYLDESQKEISSLLQNNSLVLKNYENKTALLKALDEDEVTYIIVPMMEYLDIILDKLYTINYHISELKDYYYLQNSDNKTLNSILSKFYNKWSTEKQKKYLNEIEYKLFTNKLKITEKELDVINNKKYKYGFVDYAPYDIKRGGVYGGVMSKYITEFSEFSGIDFEYVKYSNFSKLSSAVSKGKVDLFSNYYSIDTSMATIESLFRMDVSFILSNKDSRVINNINAIKNETIYVKERSIVQNILKPYDLNIKTYKNDRDLKQIFENGGIVAMDYAHYTIYRESHKDISERFRIESNTNINFQSKNDTMFNRLFSYYISTIDKNEIIYTGLYNYHRTEFSGSLIYKITEYAIIIILIVGIVVFVFYKLGKRALVKKRIKRSDKMKYIDMLTSLKNRNYLTENIPIWNRNTIYPQSIIVIDLNGIQELNDTYGYTEGDKQIQSAANALIKTQLDNSEIMRTDGNEFIIYLVGYSEKQILSYIKKLNKEFKNLPHDKKAAIGFSMIDDDVKLINDAINEATEKMRENKTLQIGESDGEKI